MLIKIGNAWIDPATIAAVEPHEASEDYPGIVDRVLVRHGSGCVEVIDCDSFGEAGRLADLIAELVNGSIATKKGALA